MRPLAFFFVLGCVSFVGGEELFCGEHEEFHLCGNHCDLTEKMCKVSPLDLDQCRPGCVCAEGFYRVRKTRICQELSKVLAGELSKFSNL
jgi:hypothetical protein